ncbi:hypothetical protein AU467_27725 [Mesorhizobium loti]|uniref:Uncharacterized protein n=1 Tax=Rhizobium loti TaxID=381 RepID=A0A117N2R4_RHILI|nr:hypothetical protein AU467_27725 [Mesorhizobium loti]
MMAISVRQEIDQQLHQTAVLASCFEMVGTPRALFVTAKKASSGEYPDVSHNAIATQIQNVCELADC